MSDKCTEDLFDLYETAPCGYLSLSPDSKVVMINRTLADWLGTDAQSLLGKSIHEILSFGGKIAFETHLAPLMRMQGHVNEIALDLIASDGTKLPTIGNAAEKRDSDGKHLFTRLTLFKAVDRRGYERSLLQAREKAEAEMKAEREESLLREQFIAVLGHDLRNPLSALGAGTEMLARREELSERGKTIIEEMRGSVARALGLIDDVLDFARGRLGGGVPVERVQTDVEPLLRQVVAEIRGIAPDREIDSRIDLPRSVFCDPARIAQLASNLLTNAVTHGDVDKPVRFEASIAGEELVVSVANAGSRIPDDVREHLFSPFFRGAARPSRNGLGLGLFISSEIARAHDGRIEATSSDEETRFTFTMPVEAERASESPGSSE